MADAHFTVAEANALLPTVRPLVERMVEYRRELGSGLDRRRELAELTGSNGGGLSPGVASEVDEAVKTAAAGIKRCVEELTVGIATSLHLPILGDPPANREHRWVVFSTVS